MADVPRFDPTALTNAAADALTVRRVYGEAYERDGATVIPVARVWGATGTGAGDGEGGGEGEGEGDLFGVLRARRRGTGHFHAGAGLGTAANRSLDAASSDAEADAEVGTDADESATDESAAGEGHGDGHGHHHGHGHGHGHGSGHGGGGGFAMHVRAVGVYVIDDRGVHWRPAVDVNRVILGAQAVAATAVTAFALTLAVKAASSAVAKGVSSIADAIASR